MSDDTLAVKQGTPQQPLIPANSSGVQLQTMEDMYRFSRAVVNSGLAPKSFNTPEAVMVAIQHGFEIGLKPMQALQSIAVINGRPCLWGDGALAVAQARPDFEDIQEITEGDVATCTIKRRGRTAVTRSFSITDAKKAALWGKSGPWTQYPGRMLQMRARSWALRDSFADALKGVGISEEVRDFSDTKAATAREIKPAIGLVLPEPENVEITSSEIVDTEEDRDEDGNFKF